MNEKEKNFMAEHETPPVFDGIAVLGRGIEKTETSGGEKWRPTRAIEKMAGRYHSGRRERNISMQDEDESVVVAGANANAIAATELFEQLQKNGTPPSVVIFSAGRPAYIEQDPDQSLSEGKILEQKFLRKVSVKTREAQPETIILDKNKNTKDDILTALQTAKEKGVRKLAIITIGLHVERSEEFYKLVVAENPELRGISVEFVPSEKLLEERYSKSPSASKIFAKELKELKESSAYKRTEEREKRGVKQLREGTYNK